MQEVKLKRDYNRWHLRNQKTKKSKINNLKDIEYYNLILNYLDEKKKIRKNKKILDVACGKGAFLEEAQKRGLKIYGLDISDVAIREAKKINKDGIFVVGSGQKMPYKNSEFDYITCLGSLEHFSHPEKGVQEISRVLKNDGVALIYVPNLMFLGHIYMTYRYGIMPSEDYQQFSEVFYTHQGWKKLLEDNGLKVENSKSYNRISATKKVSKLTIFLWENLIRFFVPFNLSYIFIFICKKK